MCVEGWRRREERPLSSGREFQCDTAPLAASIRRDRASSKTSTAENPARRLPEPIAGVWFRDFAGRRAVRNKPQGLCWKPQAAGGNLATFRCLPDRMTGRSVYLPPPPALAGRPVPPVPGPLPVPWLPLGLPPGLLGSLGRLPPSGLFGPLGPSGFVGPGPLGGLAGGLFGVDGGGELGCAGGPAGSFAGGPAGLSGRGVLGFCRCFCAVAAPAPLRSTLPTLVTANAAIDASAKDIPTVLRFIASSSPPR